MNRNRLKSAASRVERKLSPGLVTSNDHEAAAWWLSSTERSLYSKAFVLEREKSGFDAIHRRKQLQNALKFLPIVKDQIPQIKPSVSKINKNVLNNQLLYTIRFLIFELSYGYTQKQKNNINKLLMDTLEFNVETRKALVRPGWSKSCMAAATYKAISSRSGMESLIQP